MNNKISFACSPAMLAALLLGGCTIKPPSTDVMMGSIASQPQEERSLSPLLTSGDFCVAVSQQKVLAQPCSGKDDQLFEWDLGELRLQDLCLQAKNDSELMLAPCDGQAQWEWQKDRLFNSKVSRCLDVAGRRHTPGTPLRLAECYGGANQSFSWQRPNPWLETLKKQSLTW
ncbi:ricin-type beta-trefoil lectin domain protein [Aeromonas veronii]|uniref:ricin-type beta-trefoil lectin domain protein n=1 Tax=Aeromonas veronii TaxID=654 RepID=UPI0038E25E12